MKAIFSNNAISTLASPVAIGDTQIYINDLSSFPDPVFGEEYYMATLVGGCDDRVEIVRVIETCETYITVDLRGAEDTTEQTFSPGDGVFHGLTAEMMQTIINMWQWYLGPFEVPPVTDNNGYPLLIGHLYYQMSYAGIPSVSVPSMRVWDGLEWRPFDSVLGAAQVSGYTWVLTADMASGSPLPFPDSYGRAQIDFIEGTHVIDLFINGSKVIIDTGSVIAGDYSVDYDTDDIFILQDLVIGDIVEAKIMVNIGEIRDGVDGEDGEDGVSGFSPYISDGTDGNVPGNWITETGDTGISTTSYSPRFRNILINTGFEVNQRNFQGSWLGLPDGDFGYDHWTVYNLDEQIVQRIEPRNIEDNREYVLSWVGGLTGRVVGTDGNELAAGASPLKFTMFKGNQALTSYIETRIPNTATNMKLERSPVQTAYEVDDHQQDVAKCQRYFTKLSMGGYQSLKGGRTWILYGGQLPVPMLRMPTLSGVIIDGKDNDIVINGFIGYQAESGSFAGITVKETIPEGTRWYAVDVEVSAEIE